ncbi:MAG: PQQ-binding-like beta-propeller repeat protein [Pirellulaceae bacterium]|nr:PQQ-binding-like beta-propeller repeat protein [Pirellulaceae bacterium]
MRNNFFIVFLLGLALTCSTVAAEDWPAFRGPRGNGVSSEQKLPTHWSGSENIRWKTPLPEAGNGSPIVVGQQVFVTCPEDNGSKRHLICFDRQTGKQQWMRTVEFESDWPTHKTNPHSASTPACDGKFVVVWHASAGLYCYNLSGELQWSRKLGEFRHMWGDGSSPVIYGDRIILNGGPGKDNFVMGLDLASGNTLWKTDEPTTGDGERNENNKYVGSWATPVLTQIDGKDQFICNMSTRVNSYDPETGAILWTCDGFRGPKGDLAYSSAIVAGDFCVALSGFNGPSIGFKLGGSGNITQSNRVWRNEANPQSIGTGVYVDQHVYVPNAGPGTIVCIEPATGKTVWTDRAGGGNYWGSMVAAGGNLYVTNQEGSTIVFKPNPERFELVATNELSEPSNSTPAISDGQIFIRTHKHLYCVGG